MHTFKFSFLHLFVLSIYQRIPREYTINSQQFLYCEIPTNLKKALLIFFLKGYLRRETHLKPWEQDCPSFLLITLATWARRRASFPTPSKFWKVLKLTARNPGLNGSRFIMWGREWHSERQMLYYQTWTVCLRFPSSQALGKPGAFVQTDIYKCQFLPKDINFI